MLRQMSSKNNMTRFALSANEKLYYDFVDYRESFDSVTHDNLCYKLRISGITGTILTLYNLSIIM